VEDSFDTGYPFLLASAVEESGPGAGGILSLGLGIGLNLTVFGVFEAMFFRGVTAANPDRTFHLWTGGSNRASYPDFQDIRAANAVQDVFAYSIARFTLGDGEKRQRVYGQVVAGDYFETLGVQPMLGRGFTAEEKMAEREGRVVILSYGYWQQKFDGDRGVLGRRLRLNAQPFTIVGVLPATYRSMHGFALEPPFFVPYSGATDPSWRDRSGHGQELAVRSRHGQSLEQASAAVLPVVKQLERLYPKENARMDQVRMFGVGLSDAFRRGGGRGPRDHRTRGGFRPRAPRPACRSHDGAPLRIIPCRGSPAPDAESARRYHGISGGFPMSTDELLDAQAEFEKSRATSVRLLESLARKIGARRVGNRDAGALEKAPSSLLPHSGEAAGSVVRFFRQPAVAAITAVAAGYLLIAVYRHSRR
jgi:hypothetical protein